MNSGSEYSGAFLIYQIPQRVLNTLSDRTLFCLDVLAGTAMGRPMAMHDQDYDQDPPVDCDDEYWDLPEPLNFRQPNNKPSDLSYFICYAKLLEIQASVTSTIVNISCDSFCQLP